ARPEMKRDRAEVHEIEQRIDVVADEVVDLASGVLAPHAFGADPLGDEARRILLVEGLARDAVRKAGEHERAVLQVREQPRRHASIKFYEISLRVAFLRPEDLVEVGEAGGMV